MPVLGVRLGADRHRAAALSPAPPQQPVKAQVVGHNAHRMPLRGLIFVPREEILERPPPSFQLLSRPHALLCSPACRPLLFLPHALQEAAHVRLQSEVCSLRLCADLPDLQRT